MPAPRIELEVGPRMARIGNPGRVYFAARGKTKRQFAGYDRSVRTAGERRIDLDPPPGTGLAGAGGYLANRVRKS